MTSKPVSIASVEHYPWGSGCDGWHLVRTASLSVIQERMPPGTAERRHLHERSHQFFYVLEGELTLEVEGEDHRLEAGSGLEVAPKQAHQALNQGDEDVWFLVTSQPPSHGDRIDA
jgi:mannose-6-phosphate isomerase-like protein (cupin superfamily)